MTRALLFVICGLMAVSTSLATAAQDVTTLPVTVPSAQPYDWEQITGHFNALAVAVRTSSVEAALEEISDPADLQDLRVVCSEPLSTFARRLILADCSDLADCASRKASVERLARALADEVSVRLDNEAADADVFLRPGMTLRSSTTDQAAALSLRSGHDQWFRAWLDPVQAAADENALIRDEALILNRVWCHMTRDNAEAAIDYVARSGFASDSPDTGQGHLVSALVNIAIHAAWNPELTAPLRAASDHAFDHGRLSGYHAAYLVDIDTMAARSEQRVGFLWACENGRAYLAPPLISEAEAADLRRLYRLPTLEEATESRSRRCAS